LKPLGFLKSAKKEIRPTKVRKPYLSSRKKAKFCGGVV
jgi:hypothetical protein